jgi:hypothetical protein
MNFHFNLLMSSIINELQIPVFLSFFTIKDVNIEPTEFQLQPGQSREITLQFQEPANANAALLPIYSGFIYVTNEENGEVVHMSCKYSLLWLHFNCLFMNMHT